MVVAHGDTLWHMMPRVCYRTTKSPVRFLRKLNVNVVVPLVSNVKTHRTSKSSPKSTLLTMVYDGSKRVMSLMLPVTKEQAKGRRAIVSLSGRARWSLCVGPPQPYVASGDW